MFAFNDISIYKDRRLPGLFLQKRWCELSNHIQNRATIEDNCAVAEGYFVVAEAAYIVYIAERQEA